MDLKSHKMTMINVEELPTRERIIHVTIGLIAREGMYKLTTRSIAAAAGVNVAAVNYYFGSKEKLIEESLQSALNHMFSDTSDFLQNLDGKSVLNNIMLYFLEGALQYPGIIKTVLHEPIDNNNYDNPVMQQIIQFIHRIIMEMEEYGEEQLDSIKMKILQMLGATLLPALLPDLYDEILGNDFRTDSATHQKYIDSFFK